MKYYCLNPKTFEKEKFFKEILKIYKVFLKKSDKYIDRYPKMLYYCISTMIQHFQIKKSPANAEKGDRDGMAF